LKLKRLNAPVWLRIPAFILLLLIFINALPMLTLNEKGMQQKSSSPVSIYYGAEETAALEIQEAVNASAGTMADRLGLTTEEREIQLYIYDTQKSFQAKHWGFVTTFLGMDWYYYDSIRENALVSSQKDGPVARTDAEVINGALRSVALAYVYRLNPESSLWFRYGLAAVLVDGDRPLTSADFQNYAIPSFTKAVFNNLSAFHKYNGEVFSRSFIEYLTETYGWDTVLALVRSGSYEDTLNGKTDEEIYNDWASAMLQKYGVTTNS
jgi:hypothetical protein